VFNLTGNSTKNIKMTLKRSAKGFYWQRESMSGGCFIWIFRSQDAELHIPTIHIKL